MKISLIGMSGNGKSYWSKMLQKKGFERFCCDDLVEEKLENEFKKLGYSGIQDVAKWMGQPFDKQYKRSSKKYLQYEKEVLEDIFEQIENSSEDDDIVIDTTGSVIYTGKTILDKLAQFTRIIYLDLPESVKEEMYRLYIKEPKPVVWGNIFKKTDKENNREALVKCYPKLLFFRSQKYEKLADVKLDYYMLRNPKITINNFIDAIL